MRTAILDGKMIIFYRAAGELEPKISPYIHPTIDLGPAAAFRARPHLGEFIGPQRQSYHLYLYVYMCHLLAKWMLIVTNLQIINHNCFLTPRQGFSRFPGQIFTCRNLPCKFFRRGWELEPPNPPPSPPLAQRIQENMWMLFIIHKNIRGRVRAGGGRQVNTPKTEWTTDSNRNFETTQT